MKTRHFSNTSFHPDIRSSLLTILTQAKSVQDQRSMKSFKIASPALSCSKQKQNKKNKLTQD